MIRRVRNFQIFNISFLDVISCGFGAVVLLVLISKSGVTKSDNTSDVSSLLQNVFQYEATVAELSSYLEDQETRLKEIKKQNKASLGDKEKMSKELQGKSDDLAKLQEDTRGLELVQSSLKTASIAKITAKKRDVEVGGIAVDSDYVVFIIDTSGSMLTIWGRVLRTIGEVLDIHPTVRGFQILNDNGVYLLEAYRRRWIPDTPRRRKKVLEALGTWRSTSNSSPVEGLEVALKTYAKPGTKTSIYIFGDDYTGSSFDTVIKKVELLNRNRTTRKPIVKIHGVGFISGHATNRFPILMREITKRNGGTFLGLPR
ncbi:MAG TPA: hypothetical protein EYO32_15555 [Rhodospirillales bacterium]|nr:hypothetical protein [Rhodospirillales bacterium]